MNHILLEEHDEVLPYWRGLKRRLERNLTLVHVDSHSDLGIPDNGIPDIGSFILPAFQEGIIDKCIWIKHHWCREFKSDHLKFNCGYTEHDRVELRCDSEELAFMEGYAENDLLVQGEFPVEIVSVNESECPNLDFTDQDVILDIDLDFFSCRNPWRELLTKKYGPEQFRQLLREFGAIESKEDANLFQRAILNTKNFDLIQDILDNSAGYNALAYPVYESESYEWQNWLNSIWQMKMNPVFCNVVKSVGSGFTPEEDWQDIYQLLKVYLDNYEVLA